MWETVLLEIKDHVAIVKINRPKQLNALNDKVMYDLTDCMTKLAADKNVFVVIITGEGEKAFVAGADISQMVDMTPVEALAWAQLGQSVFTMIEQLPQPVIAAVNGFALGGGNELSMACDIRVASENAKLGQPETGLGIVPGFGGTQRLPRLIGLGRAKYLTYSADIIDAHKACEWGLVDFVVKPEELMNKALEIAAKIIKQKQFAVQEAKHCIRRGLEASLPTGLEFEAQAFGLCCSHQDRTDGMTAFLNKGKK